MKFQRAHLFHFALLYTCGSALDTRTKGSESLTWQQCQTVANTTTGLDCATLGVPRDYTHLNTTDSINLQLARVKATKSPFKGTVLFNSGGPGYAGRNDLDTFQETLPMVLGGHYDIVSWDFRGTGETLPFSCFPSETERSTYYARLLESATDASEVAIGQAWSTTKWMTEYCKNSPHAQDAGELIGTAFTARDMMRIVDALGEDGLLRYLGISYGTVLGETVAAMFPDRMHRVVLDAVLNPTEYYAGGSVSQLNDADKTFESFCAECFKAPELCPLSARAVSPADLASKLYTLIDEAKHEPIVLGIYGLQTYATIKTSILGGLYDAGSFPSLALYLDSLLTRNETAFALYATSIATAAPPKKPFPEFSTSSGTKENTWGIRCSDEMYRSASLENTTPLIEHFHNESRIAGDITWSTSALACAQWPFEAKERYGGGFDGIETRHPLMFVANMYDPVTSVQAARNASASFLGSQLLVNEGHGHSSFSQMSACTVAAVRAYFDEGVLPENGKVCPPTIQAFTDKTIGDVVAEVERYH